MENSNYKDFDSFFEEMEKKASITIRLFDKEYTLPSSIPASLMLDTYRMLKSGSDKVSEAKQMEMAIAMLGEENVADWCKQGLTMDQLAEIMKWASNQMQGQKSANGKGKSGGKKK